jgi:hypothetical protein
MIKGNSLIFIMVLVCKGYLPREDGRSFLTVLRPRQRKYNQKVAPTKVSPDFSSNER